MNKKIKELASQAGMKPQADLNNKFGLDENLNPFNAQGFMLEEFANLIVRECIGTISKRYSGPIPDEVRQALHNLQAHFGVN